uniref:Uncharacterized protein n=1 Tax=Anguilla anguilla TaxID=7936 RepID=A0A0E9QBS0_ANGAN
MHQVVSVAACQTRAHPNVGVLPAGCQLR